MGQYIGDCDIEEISPEIWGVDLWGMDTLTRTYKGRMDRASNFKNVLRNSVNTPDRLFRAMIRRDYGCVIEAPWATFTVNFWGKLDGKLPPPVFSNDMGVFSVVLDYALGDVNENDALSGTQVQLTYEAPSTTIRYVTIGLPENSSYDGVVRNKKQINVIGRMGAAGNVKLFDIRNGSGYSGQVTPALAQHFNGVIVIENTFSAQQVGNYAECIETNQVLIKPFTLLDTGFITSE